MAARSRRGLRRGRKRAVDERTLHGQQQTFLRAEHDQILCEEMPTLDPRDYWASVTDIPCPICRTGTTRDGMRLDMFVDLASAILAGIFSGSWIDQGWRKADERCSIRPTSRKASAVFRAAREYPSRIGVSLDRNQCSPSTPITVRNHPGLAFGIMPELRSPSPGIPTPVGASDLSYLRRCVAERAWQSVCRVRRYGLRGLRCDAFGRAPVRFGDGFDG